MFSEQLDTLFQALSFLPADLRAYSLSLLSFIFITSVIRIFWR